MSRYLTTRHPSHGCKQAYFLFGVRAGSGFSKMLIVLAENEHAVAFMERLVAADNRVSPTCELLSVHRDCSSIGVRSDMAEEVPFGNFALDMVERSRVTEDPLAYEALQEALRKRAGAPASRATVPGDAQEENPDLLEALKGLGFKAPQAKKLIRDSGASSLPLDEAVKACLRRAA